MKPALFVLFTFLSTIAFAQTDTVRLREIQKSKHKIITDRPPQAVYFLLGGSGPIFSVNYDRRFAKRVNGLGFAAGAGYASSLRISIFTTPISINYLIGRNSHFVELAGGTTLVSANIDIFDDEEAVSGTIFIYHINAGYRYQPTKGGFFIRAGISPLFSGYGQTFTSYYVGFGYNF